MYMKKVPDWVTKAEEKVQFLIDDVCREQNIDWVLVHDSKTLEDAKETIWKTLWRLSEYEHPMYPKPEEIVVEKKRKIGRPRRDNSLIRKRILEVLGSGDCRVKDIYLSIYGKESMPDANSFYTKRLYLRLRRVLRKMRQDGEIEMVKRGRYELV